MVPLDDHLELYRDARQSASSGVGDAVSLQRTDLALWSLDAAAPGDHLPPRRGEVLQRLRGDSGFSQLRERIAAQLRTSESVLAARFDPAAGISDRPDRTVRNAELAGLLRFYLGRAVRHHVMRRDAADEAEWMLGNLDKGRYGLRFTRTGLIFDLSADGTSPPMSKTVSNTTGSGGTSSRSSWNRCRPIPSGGRRLGVKREQQSAFVTEALQGRVPRAGPVLRDTGRTSVWRDRSLA